MDLSHICKMSRHFLFQKKGQLGHPDEIRAKKISLGRQMATDYHGLKKKVCFAFGENGHLTSRQLHMSGHGSAARRFVLICGYLCKSVSLKSLSNNRSILKL